jgi:hypothetical protein
LGKKGYAGANVLDFTDQTIAGSQHTFSYLRTDYQNIENFYKNISFLNLKGTKFEPTSYTDTLGETTTRTGFQAFSGSTVKKLTFAKLTKISLESTNFATLSDESAQPFLSGSDTFAYTSFPKLKSIDMSSSN